MVASTALIGGFLIGGGIRHHRTRPDRLAPAASELTSPRIQLRGPPQPASPSVDPPPAWRVRRGLAGSRRRYRLTKLKPYRSKFATVLTTGSSSRYRSSVGNGFDPLGLVGVASGAARSWLRASIRTQEQLLALLGAQDDQPSPPPRPLTAAVEALPAESLGSKMRDLLERALDQSTRSSRVELFHHILDQLVADEARIIGALSDGSASPLVNVHDWARRGVVGRAALENVALIGRTANLALPEMVPTYVSHLLSLGLVEIGPENPDLKDDYEILMAETTVLRAIKSASRGPLAAKVDKLTLTLASLGQALWAETMQHDGP
jgi:hypothetical protein